MATAPARNSQEAQQSSSKQSPQSISGIIGLGVEPPSEAEHIRAKRFLATVFPPEWDREARAAFASEPPEEDSNIAIGDKVEKPRKLDDVLTQVFSEVGYKRVAKLTYRAQWSTDEVEHILAFETYGTPKMFLHGDAGLRNRDAEAFGKACESRYANELIRKINYVYPPFHCSVHASFGKIAGWRMRHSLNTAELSQAELAKTMVKAVREKLVPCVGGIKSLATYYQFLAKDEEPMRWFRNGEYYRAAIVAYVGRKLGVPASSIAAILRPYCKELLNGIDNKAFTPEAYIERILLDADTAIAPRN